MSITKQNPRTVHLAGPMTPIGDVAAGGAITPGMLIERYNSSGTSLFRAHATAAGAAVPTFALSQPEFNKDIDDAYATNDLVSAGVFGPGALVYALLPSGQVLVAGDFLESDGAGCLRKLGSGVKLAQADESVSNTTSVTTRIRATVL